MQKRWLMLFSSFILSIPYVHADIMQTLNNVWWSVLRNVGNLGLLGVSDGNAVVALTRILIGLLVFTIIFGVLSAFGGTGGSTQPAGGNALNFLSRSQSMTVAAIIAIITAIFLPAQVLLAIGSGFGTFVGLALIGGSVIGFLYLLITIRADSPEDERAYFFVKFIACAILLWVLNAMKYHVTGVLN